MKTVNELTTGDYIAFEWTGYEGKEIIVTNISFVHDDEFIVHFLYGLKSESAVVKKSDVLAIGDNNATGKIKGWSGNYNILNKDYFKNNNI